MPGAALAMLALAGLTYGLIEVGSAPALLAAVLGVVAAVAWVRVERRAPEPMLPLGIFRNRTFSAANAMTLLVYAALGAVLFFLVLQLQTVTGYGPLAAGVATLPITICMLLLASRGGRYSARAGPRIPLTFGPIVMGLGTAWLVTVDADASYLTTVLPGLTVFGLGLSLTVAPLTATVLAAAPEEHAGLASGVSNAVARSGSLLSVAALPPLVGLSGDAVRRPGGPRRRLPGRRSGRARGCWCWVARSRGCSSLPAYADRHGGAGATGGGGAAAVRPAWRPGAARSSRPRRRPTRRRRPPPPDDEATGDASRR